VRDELESARLRLRRWRPEDRETLLRWHNNPDRMRHMHELSLNDGKLDLDLLLHVGDR
jgi:RimJ/RimL family protein N-acetyltransferase